MDVHAATPRGTDAYSARRGAGAQAPARPRRLPRPRGHRGARRAARGLARGERRAGWRAASGARAGAGGRGEGLRACPKGTRLPGTTPFQPQQIAWRTSATVSVQ